MPHVLIIEDNAVTRMLVSSALRHLGHSVVETENGKKGMRAFRKGGIDLVITDIVMPDQEGMETIRQIRAIDRDVPILVMSTNDYGYGHADYLTMTLALGATATLKKPFALDMLCEKIIALLPENDDTRAVAES